MRNRISMKIGLRPLLMVKMIEFINATHQTVIRLLPAVTISDEQIDEGCELLAELLTSHQA